MIKRRIARAVRVGDVTIGGVAPVSIQSMTKTLTADVRATVAQIRRLEACGCEIVRVAVRDRCDAEAIRSIVKRIRLPLVADIHFDERLALKAIGAGADKIRINPGNMARRDQIASVVKAAKRRRIPIRIGVNSGSVGGASPRHQVTTSPERLVQAAWKSIRLFESLKFRDIVVSLKGSNVLETILAYRELAKKCDYPFHLGVTASGLPQDGIVKSAIGIGSLLADGVGDTIRVSLTADPEEEVVVAKKVLAALNLRNFGPAIISCPTCGRCQVDLVRIVKEIEGKLHAVTSHTSQVTRPLKIAVMGCEVNGPGEAREADIGIAAGKGCGLLFRKGKVIRKVAEKDFVRALLHEARSGQNTCAG